MQFSSLNATFGRLEHRTLSFMPGLNIIEAPNEAGKSTLAAFLCVMLYGLPSRERGTGALKNRYAPWSGSVMQGQLTLSLANGQSITLTRDTGPGGAPMARFKAVYTGTDESVPALTSADCGETLTGVPREVYERSAFIRQNSLAIHASAELERRITSLITTGEEDLSYSEAEAALRRQLNARKHNKTGRIPALDEQIRSTEALLDELRTLALDRRTAEASLEESRTQANALQHAIRQHDLADAQETQRAAADAKADWQRADAEAERCYRALRDSKTPEQAVLEQCRIKLATLERLRTAASAAEERCSNAQAALDHFDAAPSKPHHSLLPYMIGSAASLLYFLLAPIPSGAAAVIGCTASSLALFLLLLFGAGRSRSGKKARKARRAALEQTLQEARAALSAQQSLSKDAERDLLHVLPISDPMQAAAYIEDALARHAAFDLLIQKAQAAQLRYETLSRQAVPIAQPLASYAKRPAQSRETLRRALDDCEAAAREAQRSCDFLDGKIRALGSVSELEMRLAELRRERDALQEEYDALTLALDALAQANQELQTRFSPALGQRAAELYHRMTGGRYHAVFLDRAFRASAAESGEPIARSADSLSQGAADQLYLAVRLALCELVLPAEASVPLVLDDALTSFDDTRCAAALEFLLDLSRTRQILLFTCQHREAQFLAGHEGVCVHTL